jgi:Arc/MetJ-type ribon-helix-helix transcriptional regulator
VTTDDDEPDGQSMETITIQLPDSQKEFVSDQVKTGAHPNVDTFFQALVEKEMKQQRKAKLDQLLRERIAEVERGDASEMTPSDWEKLRSDFLLKHGQKLNP